MQPVPDAILHSGLLSLGHKLVLMADLQCLTFMPNQDIEE